MSTEPGSSVLPTNTSSTVQGNISGHQRMELIDILTVYQKVSLAIPYILMEPFALVLNFLTLVIVWKLEVHSRNFHGRNDQQAMARSQLRTFYFIRHLVFSDLLTCFVAIPFDALEIYRLEFRRSRQYCAISKYVRFVAISTSFYILVTTNFERVWCLMFPMRPLSRNKVVYMTRGAWLAAFVINIPFLFLYRSKIEFVDNDDRYFVRVCVVDKGLPGTFARAYLGVTFLMPSIAVAVLTIILISRVWKVKKKIGLNSPGPDIEGETSSTSEISYEMRRVVLLSVNITAFFWLCASPAGFYYLITAGIGRPEFPTSYLIGRSMVIIANSSAVFNPLISILCFNPIKEKARRYLGLGARSSYSTDDVTGQVSDAADNKNVILEAVKVRSSLRKVRYTLRALPSKQVKQQPGGPGNEACVAHEETAVTEVPP